MKILKVKKFINESESLLTVEPDFVDIQYAPDIEVKQEEELGEESTKTKYSEDYHLDGVSPSTKQIYSAIKEHLLTTYSNVVLNPQKYYIGIRTDRNLAFLMPRKKLVRVVVMLPESDVKTLIKHHAVKPLSESVQRFYNGPCCVVVVESDKEMGELWALLNTLIK